MLKNSENKINALSGRATPQELSVQLGVPVLDVFGAIEAAKLQSHESEDGQIEYEVQPVVSAVLDQRRHRDEEQSKIFKRFLGESLDSYQETVRQMIREENKVAYQIKQMTESRFLEVLGQISISLGRVEAFLAQSSRILNQIDLRLARSSDPHVQQLVNELKSTHETLASAALNSSILENQLGAGRNSVAQTSNDAHDVMTFNDHWVAFEVYLTSVFATEAHLSESARNEWFLHVRRVIGMGSLELRLYGDPLLNDIRPALSNHFSAIIEGLPDDKDVLPAYEKYMLWVNACLRQGYPAILVYLTVILNRGVQLSWSGFVSTFVSEV